LSPAATLHYQVTGTWRGTPVEGASVLIWAPDGARYRLAWDLTSPQLSLRGQTSEGALQAGGLAPERYGQRHRSEQAVYFDPDGHRVRFSAKTPDAPWQPGIQDSLSALLQLAALLAAAPDRYPAGSSIGLTTVNERSAIGELWHIDGDAMLDIAGQPIPCVKLHRDPDGPYGNRLDLWLAQNRDDLPARLMVTRFNGDTVDQKWDIEPDAKKRPAIFSDHED
jgi:hypothetical protein